jgi:hypothetical protein
MNAAQEAASDASEAAAAQAELLRALGLLDSAVELVLNLPESLRETFRFELCAAHDAVDETLPALSAQRAADGAAKRAAGFVYFVQAGGSGTPIKIGWSKYPYARRSGLQTGHHDKLVIVGKFPGTADDERALHRRFAALRLEGEWLRPEPELLAFIEEVKAR